MPARYEGIRDSLTEKGVPLADAKTQAAKIYNSTRKLGEEPVTGNYEKKHGSRKEKGSTSKNSK